MIPCKEIPNQTQPATNKRSSNKCAAFNPSWNGMFVIFILILHGMECLLFLHYKIADKKPVQRS